MFTHDSIWRGIDRLATTFGYSPSGLAKTAGLDPTSFNRSKRMSPDGKPRWPSTESISKILAVTGATMTDFIALVDDAPDAAGPRVDTMPLVTLSKVHTQSCFDSDGYPKSDTWREIAFPSHDDAGHIYALKITDRSAEPVYKKNDILILSRATPPGEGSRIFVKIKDGRHLFRTLSKRSQRSVELCPLHSPEGAESFKNSDIDWMARIIWVSQ